jgi:hypothetical protein
MPNVKECVAKVEGICGGETDVIVVLKPEKKDSAIDFVIKKCVVKKSAADFMFELEFEGLTFRVFRTGRMVFRGIKNKKELNRLLTALLG